MSHLKDVDFENPCGYCQKKASRILYDTQDIYEDKYLVNQCTHCQAIFLSPRPTNEQLSRAYDESYYGEQDHKFSPTVEKILDFFRSQRANIVTRYVLPPAKVLDIGCGNGRFLQYVRSKGKYQIYGVELPGKAADRAAAIEGIQLKKGTLEYDDFETETFDVITLFHVFEHLAEPVKTLEIIQKILKTDGKLIMSFPNIDSFQSNVFKGKWLHLDPPRHLFFFKPKDFVKEMQQYGFELVSETYFSTEQNPFGMQQSILNKLFKKRELLYEYLKGNDDYTKDYSKASLLMQRAFFVLTFPLFAVVDMIESMFKKGATVEFVFNKKAK